MTGHDVTGWIRAKEGRLVAGVCGALARRLGRGVRFWRATFALLACFGLLLAVGFAIFDATLLGAPAEGPLRPAMIGLGLACLLAYPLLALFLPDERRPRSWDFASSGLLVLVLMLVGQALGVLLAPYWASAKGAWQQRGAAGWLSFWGDHVEAHGFGAKDVVLALFFVSALGFVWLQRAGVKRFFRSMTTGVTLVVLTTTAVAAGVLVPQIDGFEDPAERVDLAAEHADYLRFREDGYQKLPFELQDGHEQYQAFRWAEGYFLYHLLHPYGWRMPEAEIPPQAAAGLEAMGRKYGREEADNREKQMRAAFQGRAKVDAIGVLIHGNEDAFWRFFEVSTLLHLNRTYKSSWFASLLFLLAIAVVFNTFRGRLSTNLSLKKIGFVVVHMGVLTLLCGGFVSKLFTDRGILELRLGEPPEDVFYRHFDPRKPARMPFHVRLDHFARQDWPALEVVFFDAKFSSNLPRYTLWNDREIELDYAEGADGSLEPRLKLRVVRLHDRAEVGLPFVSEGEPGEGSVPLAEVLVHDAHAAHDHEHEAHDESDSHERRTYLAPLDRVAESYIDPFGAYRVGAVYDGDPAAFFADDAVATVGRLEATLTGADARPELVDVRLGEEVVLSTGWRLSFADATADLRRETTTREKSSHPLPLAEQPDGLAAVWVDVQPPDDRPTERRIVLEDVDDVAYGRQRQHTYPELVLRFAWDQWRAPGPPRFVLAWGPEEPPVLVSESGERTPAAIGEPLSLPGDNAMVPRQFLHHATFEKNLSFPPDVPRADGWDAEFYANAPRGLELEVTRYPGTERESVERIEMATSEAGQSHLWFSGDEDFALVFLENTQMLPFEWRSVLSILERDNSGRLYEVPLGSEKEREIRVNDYFKYRGYRFFQTNARAEDPTYSGIGVVYDPGIPIVLFGMYTIILGTVLAFLARPIALGWEKVAKA